MSLENGSVRMAARELSNLMLLWFTWPGQGDWVVQADRMERLSAALERLVRAIAEEVVKQ